MEQPERSGFQRVLLAAIRSQPTPLGSSRGRRLNRVTWRGLQGAPPVQRQDLTHAVVYGRGVDVQAPPQAVGATEAAGAQGFVQTNGGASCCLGGTVARMAHSAG